MKIQSGCFIFLTAGLCCLLPTGCGENAAPPPPKVKQTLVLDTFTALENGNHELALKKIARLREIDPSNVFLANLEMLERNNAVIKEVQKKIDEDKLEDALNAVSEGIKKYGRHDELLSVQKKLQIVTSVSRILHLFRKPSDSAQLMKAAEELKHIASSYKPAAMFLPLAEHKIAEAEIMSKWETKRAVIDLLSQIDTLQKENDEDVPVLYAILANMDPTNPALINYLTYLHGDEGIDLTIYRDENIFEEPEDNGSTGDSMDDDSSSGNSDGEKKDKSWWNKFSF